MERPTQRQRGNEDEPHRDHDGVTTFFGVDVTDVGQTSQEMSDLGPRGQAYVFQERERLGMSRSTRGGRGGRGRGGGGRGNYNTNNDSRRQVGAIETVVTDEMSGVTEPTVPPNRGDDHRPPSVPPPVSFSPPTSNTRGSETGVSLVRAHINLDSWP